jgi:hypothetical protein
MCLQEAGGSEEDIQLAVARAHERMLQAELAESQAPAAQAGPSEPQQQQPARGGRPPPDGSRAASSRQAEQVRALNRLEVRTQDTLPLPLAGMGCSQSNTKHYPHILFSAWFMESGVGFIIWRDAAKQRDGVASKGIVMCDGRL